MATTDSIVHEHKSKRDVDTRDTSEPHDSSKKHKHSKKSKEGKKHSFKTLKDALSKDKLSDLLSYMRDSGLVYVTTEHSLIDALKILITNKILSAPVFDPKTDEIAGFVDTIDIVSASVQILQQAMKEIEKENSEKKSSEQGKLDDDDKYFIEDLMLRTVSAGSITDLSGRDPYLTCFESDTVDKALFSLSAQNHHRLAVFEHHDTKDSKHKKDKLRGVVTQSGLALYVVENYPDLLDHYSKVKIQDMKHLKDKVETVGTKTTAYEAFKLMKEKGVSALPIVNDKGAIIEVISASDLMFWSDWVVGTVVSFSNLEALTKPVLEFIKESRAQRGSEKSHPVTCEMEDFMTETLDKMLFYNVHRIFVVDEANHPISVVNFADIFSHLKD